MPRKKRSTFGSVAKLGPDRWRLRWWADGPDGRKRRTEIVRGTRRQADDRLAEIRLGVGSAPGGCPTVGHAYEAWFLPDLALREADGRVAPNYVQSIKSVWRKHIAPRWAAVPANAVRPIEVQEWLLDKKGQTSIMCRNVLRQVLAFCEMYEVVDRNPLDKKYRTGEGENKRDKGIYTIGQLGVIASAARGSFAEGAFLLSAFGSCRVGESLGVMAHEVELVECEGVPVARAHVVRQVDNRTGKPVDRLKNKQSRRWVVVPGPVGARLYAAATEALGRGDTWLCDRGDGTPATQRVLATEWNRIVLRAGTVERHPFQNLRNSWLTYMRWELGANPETVEPMMGHSSKTTTGMFYDRGGKDHFTQFIARLYKAHPFADGWDI